MPLVDQIPSFRLQVRFSQHGTLAIQARRTELLLVADAGRGPLGLPRDLRRGLGPYPRQQIRTAFIQGGGHHAAADSDREGGVRAHPEGERTGQCGVLGQRSALLGRHLDGLWCDY